MSISYASPTCGSNALLKLDWDRDDDVLPMDEIRRRLHRARYRLATFQKYRSPSGRGWHVVAVVDPEPTCAEEVVALQLLLNSDINREACNLNRAKTRRTLTDDWWKERWNVLYD